MKAKMNVTEILKLGLIAIIQYALAILCVFLFPGLGGSFLLLAPLTNPVLGHLSLLAAYSTGIFVGGWLGLVLLRRDVKKPLLVRLINMLLGIMMPLMIALFVGDRTKELFYFIAILTGIAMFYAPEWNRNGKMLD
jgi:hypothetical protein